MNLAELKEIFQQNEPGLFFPGRESTLIRTIDAYILKCTMEALGWRNAYLQSVMLAAEIGTQMNNGAEILDEANSALAKLFQEWRDELKEKV